MLSNIQAKLLIVDDLPENLLALEALIKREDRMVYKALSADEALSLLLQHEFAMAILDVQMPGICTSRMAMANSCCSSSDKASSADKAL